MSDNIFTDFFTEETAQEAEAKGNLVQEVPTDNIRPNPFNREITEVSVKELQSQLEKDDFRLIHPINVVLKPNSECEYMIVAGERRWRAFRDAKRQSITAIIRDDLTDKDIKRLNLTENLHVEPEKVLEQAVRMKAYAEEFGLTQANLAKEMGKGRSVVSELFLLADVENIPVLKGLYDEGVKDRTLLAALVRVYKKSPEACTSVISFAQSNGVLTRRFVSDVLAMDLYGDIESDMRKWLTGESDDGSEKLSTDSASLESEKTVPGTLVGEDKGSQEETAEGPGTTEPELSEEQLDLEVSETDDDREESEDIETDTDTGANNTEEKQESDDDSGFVVDEVQIKKRPMGKAEICLEFEGENYYLDLGHVSTQDGLLLVRTVGGDYKTIPSNGTTIQYVV